MPPEIYSGIPFGIPLRVSLGIPTLLFFRLLHGFLQVRSGSTSRFIRDSFKNSPGIPAWTPSCILPGVRFSLRYSIRQFSCQFASGFLPKLHLGFFPGFLQVASLRIFQQIAPRISAAAISKKKSQKLFKELLQQPLERISRGFLKKC